MRERKKQVLIYFKKFMGLFWRTGGWKALVFGIAISALITMVISEKMFLYGSNTESGCFSLVSACIWIGVFNSIQSICRERDIVKREHRSGLHISAYIIARAMYEFVICLVQAVLIILVCVVALDFPNEGLVTFSIILDYFITFLLVLICSDYLGLAVSAIVKSTNTAMMTMPFILILQLVFSGVLFELKGLASKISLFTISSWGMEALGSVSNVDGLTYNEIGWYMIPRDVYSYEPGHVGLSWLFIILFSILWLAIAIISLEFVDKDKR